MTTNFELARSLQAQISWLAVNGKKLTLIEVGVRLSEIYDLYTQIYCSSEPSARLQDFFN